MNSLKSLGSALLVIAILIASYGIYHAPTSDASQLEAELEKNEQALAREEATPAGFPSKTPAGTTATQTAATTGTPDISQSSLSVIGDSVFLGAAPAFKKLYKNAVIDAKVSRQVVQALDIAKNLDKKESLETPSSLLWVPTVISTPPPVRSSSTISDRTAPSTGSMPTAAICRVQKTSITRSDG